jgi:hypothetical protein|tara:strand:+ start:8825 stop:9121 length:297 start_codon:yes stop_codon:yes gene_type:complete
MPNYYESDNPHKKSKKESISIILLGAPDRMKGDDNYDMEPEEYAMSMMDDEQKEDMKEEEAHDMSDLPVKDIMSALDGFDIPSELLSNIEMHLKGKGC